MLAKALQAIEKPPKKPPKKPLKKLINEQVEALDEANLEAFNESLPEFSKSERIELAYKAWKELDNMSIRKAARIHGISYTTLLGRTKGTLSDTASRQARQRLLVGEEEALQSWLLQLNQWGQLARIS